jgi:broad specificity phosphatase PhoE
MKASRQLLTSRRHFLKKNALAPLAFAGFRRLLLMAIAGSAMAIHAQAPAGILLDGQSLIEALRKGGYVIFFRHPQTDSTKADTDTLNLDNISAQRQLTPKGEAQARQIGDAFRTLKIPVGTVLTSQYHRAKEAARLAGFSGATAVLDLTEPQNVPPVEGKRRAEALRKLLGTAPTAGTNAVLIAHRPNLQDAAGKEFGDLGEGEAAVFEPLGEKGYRLVARVTSPETWPKWAAEFAKE